MNRAIDYDCKLYEQLLNIKYSKEYRLGHILLAPFDKIARIIRRWRK